MGQSAIGGKQAKIRAKAKNPEVPRYGKYFPHRGSSGFLNFWESMGRERGLDGRMAVGYRAFR
jgi:hypothetical protein